MNNLHTTSGNKRGLKIKYWIIPGMRMQARMLHASPTSTLEVASNSLLSLVRRVLSSATRYLRMNSCVIIIHNFVTPKASDTFKSWILLIFNTVWIDYAILSLCSNDFNIILNFSFGRLLLAHWCWQANLWVHIISFS